MADNEENEGFEDLTEPNVDGAQTDAESESDVDSEDATADSGEDSQDDPENAPDPAMDTAALEAQIAILQTENQLLNEEVEKWKGINLQLLLAQANDATVGTEDEDLEGDDPAPYKTVSGADSLFTTKES